MSSLELAATPAPLPAKLTRSNIRVLALSALGGALEFYDFIVFVYLSHTVETLFFPTDMPGWLKTVQTFGLVAVGYLIRPIGGSVMAHFGDRVGRKALFMCSILLMAIPTLMIGLLPTYAQWGVAAPLMLLCLRVCQGIAFSGEGPGAITFVAEHVAPRHVGLACGMLAAGFMAGLLLGVAVTHLCQAFFSVQQQLSFAWRLPFLLGGVLGVVALWVRRYLHETPVFARIQARQQHQALPLYTVLCQHRRAVVVLSIAAFIQSALFISVVLLTPQLMPKIIPVASSVMMNSSIVVVMATGVGCWVGGYLVDRWGDAKTWLTCCILGGGSFGLLQFLILTARMDIAQSGFVLLYAFSAFALALTGVVSAMAAKRFPTEVRFTGVSFSTNVAYACSGGITPLLLSVGIHYSPWVVAGYVGVLTTAGALLGAILLKMRCPCYL